MILLLVILIIITIKYHNMMILLPNFRSFFQGYVSLLRCIKGFFTHTCTHTHTHSPRYLLKQFSQKLPMSKLSVNVAYLGSDFPVHKYCAMKTSGQFTDPQIQLEAYRQRARRWVGLGSCDL